MGTAVDKAAWGLVRMLGSLPALTVFPSPGSSALLHTLLVTVVTIALPTLSLARPGSPPPPPSSFDAVNIIVKSTEIATTLLSLQSSDGCNHAHASATKRKREADVSRRICLVFRHNRPLGDNAHKKRQRKLSLTVPRP